jgi:cation transport regulator
MPYKETNDLPEQVQNALSNVPHAQEIYKEAYNSAFAEYKDSEDRDDDASREEVSHRVAWSAVKTKYEKGADDNWHPKD